MSKAQSRIAALGLLFVALGGLLWLFSYPLISVQLAQADEIERKEKQTARYRQLADGQEALQAELALLRRRSPAATYYVAG